jgi:hypothetical protein
MPGKRNRRRNTYKSPWLLLEVWHSIRPWLKVGMADQVKLVVSLVFLSCASWLTTILVDGLERTILIAFHFIGTLWLLIRKTPDA